MDTEENFASSFSSCFFNSSTSADVVGTARGEGDKLDRSTGVKMDADDEEDVDEVTPRTSNAEIDGGGFLMIGGGLFIVDKGGSFIAEFSLRDTLGRSKRRVL